jgi:hypothetical protein
MYATALQHLTPDFRCQLGDLLRPHMHALLCYKEFYVSYTEFARARSSLTHDQEERLYRIDDDFSKEDFAERLTLTSFLNIFWQRPMKLLLQLREIFKLTPVNHPDYKPLKNSSALAEQSIKQLNAHDDDAPRPEIACLVDEPHRQLFKTLSASFIDRFPVQLARRRHTLLLFPGMFWLCNADRHVDEVRLADVRISEFASASITIAQPGKDDFCLRLENGNPVRSKLLADLRSAHEESSACPFSLTWTDTGWKLPELDGHAMCLVGDCLWLYGGRDRRGDISGNLFRVSLADGSCQTIAGRPQPRVRFGSTLVRSEDADKEGFYIYGGTVDGKQGLRDFWVFEFGTLKWERIPMGDGQCSPPKLIGCALTAFSDCLMLVGGTGPGGGCPVFKFMFESRRWEEVPVGVTMSLTGHSLFVIDDDTGLVVGGKEDTDVLCISKTGEVTRLKTTGIAPTGRDGPACVQFGFSFLVFGDEKTKAVYTLNAGDGKRSRWVVARDSPGKDHPSPTAGYALCPGENCVWLHGGKCDRKTQGELYRVEIVVRGERRRSSVMDFKFGALETEPVRVQRSRERVKEDNWLPNE